MLGPTLTITSPRATQRPPATSIPHACQRAMRIGGLVPVDEYGEPTERWWEETAHLVHDEVHRMRDRFEPYHRVDVRLATLVGTVEVLARNYGPPFCIRIDAYREADALATLRSFALLWERNGMRLDPISHNAWCEAWRSLYSPDAVETKR